MEPTTSAESIRSTENVYTLYKRSLGRFVLNPSEQLEIALRKLYSDDAQPNVIELVSPGQELITGRGVAPGETDGALLSHAVEKRLGQFKNKPYRLARYVRAVSEVDEVGFEFSALLNAPTIEQLRACVRDGLNQSIFGRQVLELTLWIPNQQLTPQSRRKNARTAVKRAVFGSDSLNEPNTRLKPPSDRAAQVTGLAWRQTINKKH